MASTAGEVIDEARDFHPAFNDLDTTDKSLLRALSRFERRIAGKVTSINESALAATITFRSVELGAMRGIKLPDNLGVLEASVENAGRVYPLSLVSYADRYTTGLQRFPSAYLAGSVLHPINLSTIGFAYGTDENTGWGNVDTIRVMVVPVPPKFESLEDEIHLPESVYDALVLNLAVWMAQRLGVPIPGLEERARDAEGVAVTTLAELDSASTWMIRITDPR